MTWILLSSDLILDQLGQQVANYVSTFAPEQPFDIVGFSMGGIVSRYYVQRLWGIDRVQRLHYAGFPHHGTWMAYLCERLVVFRCVLALFYSS